MLNLLRKIACYIFPIKYGHPYCTARILTFQYLTLSCTNTSTPSKFTQTASSSCGVFGCNTP